MTMDSASAMEVSGPSVAAILFLLVDDTQAAQLVTQLAPTQVGTLAEAVYALSDADDQMIAASLRQFARRIAAGPALADGAGARLRQALDQTIGPVMARTMMDRVAPNDSKPMFERLGWLDAPALHSLLVDEHPQLIAVVLGHVQPAIAAQVIRLFDTAMQENILLRIAALRDVTPDILRDAEAILLAKGTTPAAPVTGATRGTADVAAILNGLSRAENGKLLKNLARHDKILARHIEDQMLTFDDLARLDDRALSALLQAVPSDALAPALSGATPAFRKRLLASMSARAAQSVEDDLRDAGQIASDAIQAAQRQIVATARRLEDEGQIQLSGSK